MTTRTSVELQTVELQTLQLQPLGVESSPTNNSPSVSASARQGPALLVDASIDESPDNNATTALSKSRAVIVNTQLISLQLSTSFCNGIIVVGLPAIASTLNLEANLLLWPTSVFYLTAGSCLMLAGSVADVVGTRPMMLAANILLVASALACGLARNGGEIIAFRGLQGVSSAMAVPVSVSIISTSVEYGRPRNFGFACLGFSGPLGFLIGLVLGGVLVDSVGWRPAFYLAAASSFLLCAIGFWVLPQRSSVKTQTHN